VSSLRIELFSDGAIFPSLRCLTHRGWSLARSLPEGDSTGPSRLPNLSALTLDEIGG
jgi:hypothetical protein